MKYIVTSELLHNHVRNMEKPWASAHDRVHGVDY